MTAPSATHSWDTPDPRQLMFYTLVLVAFVAASSVPTPLYPLYQHQWHFSTAMLTLVFATYLFTLLLTLLVTGALSDHLGRRPIVLGGLILEVLAMACFWGAQGLDTLLLARALQGIATGLVTSALGAAIIESDHLRGPVLASAGPLFGTGLGALGSSILADTAPYPLRLVFIVMIGLFAWQIAGLRHRREYVVPRPGALRSMRPRAHVPAEVRATFLRVIPANIASWTLGGFSLSLGPHLVQVITGNDSAMLGGLVIFLLTATGSLSVWRLRGLPTDRILRVASTLLPTGMVIVLASVYLHATWLLLAGITVAGVGFGTGFMGSMRAVMPLAPPEDRSSLMAAFYVASYLSASLPALIAGVAIQYVGFEPVVYVYGSCVVMLSLMVLINVLRGPDVVLTR
ncbi:MFS transporter [Larsenimonas rhizosphaerae]|uniref:MFS transporter n=1 Tax=Larsenimonas rhizosphaerae TaxID=2944682 RepID=UPI0020340A90|nr:MFS transporter [Larsenimonas rhizosphaerae]MCM2131931.1 MFS transporter [Larsenimonas rhizosphaerae]